jgi:hypothetical protein
MVLAGETVFMAGAPDALEPGGGRIVAISVKDRTTLRQYDVAAPPVFDGFCREGAALRRHRRREAAWPGAATVTEARR